VDSPQHTRRLAAIVFTDIVGFSKMSSGDEVTALELLAAQKQIVQPLVQEFGGQWLKEMKDECIKVLETVKDKPLGMEVGELKTDKLWDAVRDHPTFRAIVD
tara:strand:+ start:369 stop:674 length:306 start_codon:yes stop_codon:yes gene_type:complete